jgi:hypothetical protein
MRAGLLAQAHTRFVALVAQSQEHLELEISDGTGLASEVVAPGALTGPE